jgi:hypothetical protein
MMHTFLCRKCEATFQAFVPAVEMPRTEPCPECQSPSLKCFLPETTPRVNQDTYRNPVKLSSLHGCPVVESRSDRRRAMKQHDRKYGTSLVEG